MKECSVCKTKETPQWYSGPLCKSCYRKKHRKENIQKYKETDKTYYKHNKERVLLRQKEYYQNNTEICKNRSRNHRAIAGDQHSPGYYEKWRKENKEHYLKYFRFANSKRRAKLLQATPPWLTKEHWDQIKEMYDKCPSGYEVDHIMPLQGKELCGLHVPWNLQYLTADENRKKKNKV